MTPERALQIALAVLASNPHLFDRWSGNSRRTSDAGTTQWVK